MKPTNKSPKQKTASVPKAVALPGVFPSKTTAHLKYVEMIQLDPTAGQFKTYLFSTNSCYDPNYTGTGHQPLLFDQFAAIYSHYIVTHSSIKVTALSAPTVPAAFGVLVSDNNGSSGPYSTVLEQPGSANVHNIKLPTSTNPVSCGTEWSLQKAAGVVDPVDAEDYGAVVGASPADQNYFIVFYQAMDLSTDLGNAWFLVELAYDVQFNVMKELPSS